MNRVLAWLAGLLALFGLSWSKTRRDRQAGRVEAERDAAEEGLNHAQEANDERERLRTDRDHFERVRDEFRRD